MGFPVLVLDTNVLNDKGFVHWLRTYRGRKILPIVAYVETGVHFRAQGRIDWLPEFLRAAGIDVEWMRSAEADQAIETAHRVGDFAVNARDHMIGAHACSPDRILVTRNARDYSFVSSTIPPEEAMRRWR